MTPPLNKLLVTEAPDADEPFFRRYARKPAAMAAAATKITMVAVRPPLERPEESSERASFALVSTAFVSPVLVLADEGKTEGAVVGVATKIPGDGLGTGISSCDSAEFCADGAGVVNGIASPGILRDMTILRGAMLKSPMLS